MDTGRTSARVTAGVVAACAGAGMIFSSMMGWISTPMASGGRTTISGWGSISGGDELVDGVNINTLMAGVEGAGTFRPGLVVAIAGIAVLITGLIVAASGARRTGLAMGSRASRVVALLLGLSGLTGGGWALWKLISPGDAMGVLPAGQAGIGVGPVVALLCGVIAMAVAGLAFGGLLDPPTERPIRQRGVQP